MPVQSWNFRLLYKQKYDQSWSFIIWDKNSSILTKGPYLPCLCMTDSALLAGYPHIFTEAPMICTWISTWVNNREAGDLRSHHGPYDVIVMKFVGAAHNIFRNFNTFPNTSVLDSNMNALACICFTFQMLTLETDISTYRTWDRKYFIPVAQMEEQLAWIGRILIHVPVGLNIFNLKNDTLWRTSIQELKMIAFACAS